MKQDVWLPILTLVLGYVGSLVTEGVRDRRIEGKEDRKNRADFQRMTLLELQEPLHDLGLATYVIIDAKWKGRTPPQESAEAFNRGWSKSGMLRERVDDESIRFDVKEMRDFAKVARAAATEADAQAALLVQEEIYTRVNERIGKLLRSL